MIGVSSQHLLERIWRRTSLPCTRGRLRSRIIRPGPGRPAASILSMNSTARSPFGTMTSSHRIACSWNASRMRLASAGLSSITTTEVKSGLEPCSVVSCPGGSKEKRRTSSGLRFHPDAASCTFHDALADGQSHAGAWIVCGGMQALKHSKDLLLVSGVDTDPVVFNRDTPEATTALRSNVNTGG